MEKKSTLTIVFILWLIMSGLSQNWNWSQVLSLNLPTNDRIVGMASNGHDVSLIDSTQYVYVTRNGGISWDTLHLLSNSIASCIAMDKQKVYYGTTGVGRNDVYYSLISNMNIWDSLQRGYPSGQRFTYVKCMAVIGHHVFTGNGIGLWQNDTLIAYGNHYNMESMLTDSNDLYAVSGVLSPGYAYYHCDTALSAWTVSLALDTSFGNEQIAVSNGYLYKTNSGTINHKMWKCNVTHPVSCLNTACWQQVVTPHNFRRIVAIADTLIAIATDVTHPIQYRADTLFVSTDGGVSWNKVINGLPSKYIVNALAATKYDVYIGLYCSSTGMSYVYRNRQFATTSIPDISFKHVSDALIYPNPVSDNVFIGCNNCFVKIYDLNGCLILSTRNKDQIDLSSVKPGIYIVRIDEYDRSLFRKIVVLR
jgi:hypothetical protein